MIWLDCSESRGKYWDYAIMIALSPWCGLPLIWKNLRVTTVYLLEANTSGWNNWWIPEPFLTKLSNYWGKWWWQQWISISQNCPGISRVTTCSRPHRHHGEWTSARVNLRRWVFLEVQVFYVWLLWDVTYIILQTGEVEYFRYILNLIFFIRIFVF